jgi:hypothetical protein
MLLKYSLCTVIGSYIFKLFFFHFWKKIDSILLIKNLKKYLKTYYKSNLSPHSYSFYNFTSSKDKNSRTLTMV